MSSAVRAVTVKKTKSYIPETDVTLDNGSIVHWSERIGHKVPVTCGGLCCNHVKRLVRIYKLEDREKFTGLCNKCRATKYFDDITNPITKSQFLITKKTEKGTPVICGRCPADHPPRIVLDPDLKGTGYCPEHCHDHRKLAGEREHESGAKMLMEGRDLTTRSKVAFLCANRDNKKSPNCLNKDITWLVNFSRESWRGLCQACKKQRGNHRKLIHDEEFSFYTTKHILHWSEEDKSKKRVPATCGWCGTKEEVSRIRALEIRQIGRNDPREWRCRTCYDDPSLMIEKMRKQQEIITSSITVERRPLGRPSENRSQEREQLKARFESIVRSLHRELPQSKILRGVIAEEYHQRGERLTPTTITKRVQLLYGKDKSVADAVTLVLEECP